MSSIICYPCQYLVRRGVGCHDLYKRTESEAWGLLPQVMFRQDFVEVVEECSRMRDQL